MPNHGTVRRYDDGCHCDLCAAAKRTKGERHKRRLQRRVRDGDPTVRHGSPKTYAVGGCRCAPCTQANTRAVRKWVAKHPDRSKPPIQLSQHGTPTGYAYGCRCVACTHAGVAQNTTGRRRRQAETRPTADRAGRLWTGAELEIVVTRTDLTLTELARMLGRSYEAVKSARQRATRDPKWIEVAGVGDVDNS